MAETCKVCNSKTDFLFDTVVLNKFKIKYFKCSNCEFIETEEPFWLAEAYTSPIANIDIGLLHRNIILSKQILPILKQMNTKNSRYLDFGGGYGVFVRLMRDLGYNFYLTDKFADNLFAKYFELNDATIKSNFTALTAFEVFEHLVTPIEEIETMFEYSDTIIFSTELQPREIKKASDWWYFAPEGGQHVSLYHYRTLMYLAEYFKCELFSNQLNLHILTRNKAITNPFAKNIKIKNGLIKRIYNRLKGGDVSQKENSPSSLLMEDFEYVKQRI